VHPYIYSEAEIVAIIEHARTLPSVYGMRGLTCSTLFGLIAVTGLRISEALGLDPADLDIESGVLHVRQGKLGKERMLPLDPSVVQRLESYGRERDRLLGRRPEAFFVTCDGHRLGDCGARYNFAQVCQQIGLRKPQLYLAHGSALVWLECEGLRRIARLQLAPGRRQSRRSCAAQPIGSCVYRLCLRAPSPCTAERRSPRTRRGRPM
jgi:integrase